MAKFPNTGNEEVPPGATPAAHNRPTTSGGPPGSGGGDIHAAGTPGGGTSVGGLAGSNVGDGDPDNVDLEDAMGDGLQDNAGGEEGEDRPPYAGQSGGAVGGTPAEDRASGGRIHGGLTPGGVHRGDSTIGSNPPSGKGMSREEAERAARQLHKRQSP